MKKRYEIGDYSLRVSDRDFFLSKNGKEIQMADFTVSYLVDDFYEPDAVDIIDKIDIPDLISVLRSHSFDIVDALFTHYTDYIRFVFFAALLDAALNLSDEKEYEEYVNKILSHPNRKKFGKFLENLWEKYKIWKDREKGIRLNSSESLPFSVRVLETFLNEKEIGKVTISVNGGETQWDIFIALIPKISERRRLELLSVIYGRPYFPVFFKKIKTEKLIIKSQSDLVIPDLGKMDVTTLEITDATSITFPNELPKTLKKIVLKRVGSIKTPIISESIEKFEANTVLSKENVLDYITRCKNLREIEMTNSTFFKIPHEFADLEKLTRMRIVFYGKKHDFVDNIPKITSLKELTCISVFSKIPKTIANLSNLETLTVEGNEELAMISEIPPDIGKLSKLKILNLKRNKITSLPSALSDLNIISLDLSDNRISDVTSISKITSLVYLDLSYNPISDISPLCALHNLREIYLHRTAVTFIPRCFFYDVPNIECFSIPDTKTLNAIPRDILNWKKLRTLNISFTALKYIPRELFTKPDLDIQCYKLPFNRNKIRKVPKQLYDHALDTFGDFVALNVESHNIYPRISVSELNSIRFGGVGEEKMPLGLKPTIVINDIPNEFASECITELLSHSESAKIIMKRNDDGVKTFIDEIKTLYGDVVQVIES